MLSDEARARVEFHEAVDRYTCARRYNMGKLELRQLYEFQDSRCAYCHELLGEFVVDHDHKTGVVRGLLHMECNWKGVSDHTEWTAQDLLQYLRRPPAQELWSEPPSVDISGSVRTEPQVRAV